MASVRRIEARIEPSCKRHTNGVPDKFLEWSVHAYHADAERRAEGLKRERDQRDFKARERRRTQSAGALERRIANSLGEINAQRCHAEREADRRRQVVSDARVKLAISANPELQALQRRCVAERARDEQSLFLLQRELREEQDRQHELVELEAHALHKQNDDASALQSCSDLRSKRVDVQREVLSQISQKEASCNQLRGAELREDRARMQEAVFASRQQDVQMFDRKRCLQAEVRGVLDRLVRLGEMRCAQEAAQDVEATRRADMELKARDSLAERFAMEWRRAQQARAEVLRLVGEAMQRLDFEGRQLEHLKASLQQEEQALQWREEKERELQRKIRERDSAVRVCQENVLVSLQRQQIDREADEQWRQVFLAKLAEDDRIEQLTAQRRRLKLQEHGRQAEEAAQQRRAQQEHERRKDQEEAEACHREELRQLQVIEEERHRLLSEHQLLDIRRSLGQDGRALHLQCARAV